MITALDTRYSLFRDPIHGSRKVRPNVQRDNACVDLDCTLL